MRRLEGAGTVNEEDFKKALVVTPHPDDAEIVAGGTIAKWTSDGKEVVLCVVTNGALGSNEPGVTRNELIELRRQEQEEAARLLGVSDVVFLGYEDGFVEDSHELRKDLIKQIRRHRPEVAVGVDPATYYVEQWYINHPDHRKVGEAFLAAVNPGATTLPLYRSDLYDRGFVPHQLDICLLAASLAPDHFVDVTDFMDTKLAALKAHRSQMNDWESMEQIVRSMSEWMAAQSGDGATYSEGFKAFYFPGVQATGMTERGAASSSGSRHSRVSGAA